jgi:hypothetical protein
MAACTVSERHTSGTTEVALLDLLEHGLDLCGLRSMEMSIAVHSSVIGGPARSTGGVHVPHVSPAKPLAAGDV